MLAITIVASRQGVEQLVFGGETPSGTRLALRGIIGRFG